MPPKGSRKRLPSEKAILAVAMTGDKRRKQGQQSASAREAAVQHDRERGFNPSAGGSGECSDELAQGPSRPVATESSQLLSGQLQFHLPIDGDSTGVDELETRVSMGREQLIEQTSNTREGIELGGSTRVSELIQYPSHPSSGQQNVETSDLGAQYLNIPGVGLSRIIPVRNEIGGAQVQGLNFTAAGPSLGHGFVQETLPPRLGVQIGQSYLPNARGTWASLQSRPEQNNGLTVLGAQEGHGGG